MRESTLRYLESELIYHAENKSLINSNLLTDKQRNRLMDQVQAVDHLYQSVHEDMQMFIEMKYWDNERWERVAATLQISRTSCFKLRRIFVEKLADEMGLI